METIPTFQQDKFDQIFGLQIPEYSLVIYLGGQQSGVGPERGALWTEPLVCGHLGQRRLQAVQVVAGVTAVTEQQAVLAVRAATHLVICKLRSRRNRVSHTRI